MTARPYKIISIGASCATKYHIDIFTKKTQETYLFDWQVVDIKTVIQILEDPTPAHFFDKDSLEVYGNSEKNAYIKVSSLNSFRSIHDVPYPYSEKNLDDYVEKQQRRVLRFLCLFQSVTPVFLIYNGYTDIDTANRLIQVLRELNPVCSYYAFFIKDRTEVLSERFAYIRLPELLEVPNRPAWTKSHLDWNWLFERIDMIHSGTSLEEALTR